MTFDGGARISGQRFAPLRIGSAANYFKKNLGLQTGVLLFPPKAEMEHPSGCEQQPSPKARETRPPRGRVFRFLRRDFEGVGQGGRSRRVSEC